MSWFQKPQYTLLKAPQAEDRVPSGLCSKCPRCGVIQMTRDLEKNLNVCSKCEYHAKIGAWERVAQIVDKDTFTETYATMTTGDPLEFRDLRSYPEQIARYQKRTGLREAIVTGYGKIRGLDVSLGFMDAQFIAASMGSVVGEKVARIFEYSIEHRVPAVIFCAVRSWPVWPPPRRPSRAWPGPRHPRPRRLAQLRASRCLPARTVPTWSSAASSSLSRRCGRPSATGTSCSSRTTCPLTTRCAPRTPTVSKARSSS